MLTIRFSKSSIDESTWTWCKRIEWPKGPWESIGFGKGRERKGRTRKEEGGERKSVPWWILLKMSWLDDVATVELTRSKIFAHDASTEVQPADVYCMLLPPPRRLCCHRRLFVGMLVCLFARLQKPPNRFLQNLAEGCGAHGRSKESDYVVVVVVWITRR